jgi:uncharacterized protein (DUF362 family)
MMAKPKVVIIRGKSIYSSQGDVSQEKLVPIFHQGFSLLTGIHSRRENLRSLLRGHDIIGIKINTIGAKKLSTRPEVSQTLADLLVENGIRQRNILIWDRTNRELRAAGYRLSMNRNGLKIFGTDSQDIGYDSSLTSHHNIGSLFSTIQSRMITSSISLAILKDHGLAGITAGMKNYFGAIHNPNKYHDFNCNPFIPELFDTRHIKKKHKISILDCLTVQYHRGPSYNPKWVANYGGVIFSKDPVAADFIGWQIIEKLREEKGLPTLKEEQREPLYLKTAEKMGLGQASLNKIKLIEAEV